MVTFAVMCLVLIVLSSQASEGSSDSEPRLSALWKTMPHGLLASWPSKFLTIAAAKNEVKLSSPVCPAKKNTVVSPQWENSCLGTAPLNALMHTCKCFVFVNWKLAWALI